MKIRIQGNSIRLRLSQDEVQRWQEADEITSQITFGPDQSLTYRIQKSDTSDQLFATFNSAEMGVFVPRKMADGWTRSDEIGLTGFQDLPQNQLLSILIEKDLPCKHPKEA